MGISNSNMAFGHRLTPDLASRILATARTYPGSPVPRLAGTDRLSWGRRPRVAEDN